MGIQVAIQRACMTLRQFARLGASRLYGTMKTTDGRYKASVDFLERMYFMRAENNAILKILFDKGIITVEEWQSTVLDEYGHYIAELKKEWPELTFDSAGFTIVDRESFAARMTAERWPP